MDNRLKAIHHQFNQMELKKQELLVLLQSLPAGQYHTQPDQRTWSVGQVAQHLYMSERNSLAYLKKKLSYPDTVPRFHPKSWGGIGLIKLVFAIGYKIKAPESIDMSKMESIMDLEELKTKWGELRLELISFLERNEPTFGRHMAFRHPFAGRMTMHQMLIFINDHFRHHQQQIKRILLQLSEQSRMN